MKAFQVGPDEKNDIILLSNINGVLYACGNKCSHFGAPLNKGLLFEDRVYCPYHLASFSVKTGFHDYGPVFKGIPTYEVEIKEGKVYVKVPKKIVKSVDVSSPDVK